jgi:energy-coupling factor transporter transmembrane protein EcfT
MQARGYDGEIRSLPAAGVTRRDRTLLGAVLIVFLLITFWGILIG